MLLLLVAMTGCTAIVAFGGSNALLFPRWNAVIAAPSSALIVLPSGRSTTIIIEVVPVNGVFLPGQTFFDDFVGANQNLSFLCPGILIISTPWLSMPSWIGSGVPQISIGISPIGSGTCLIPINLGLSGTVTLNVQAR